MDRKSAPPPASTEPESNAEPTQIRATRRRFAEGETTIMRLDEILRQRSPSAPAPSEPGAQAAPIASSVAPEKTVARRLTADELALLARTNPAENTGAHRREDLARPAAAAARPSSEAAAAHASGAERPAAAAPKSAPSRLPAAHGTAAAAGSAPATGGETRIFSLKELGLERAAKLREPSPEAAKPRAAVGEAGASAQPSSAAPGSRGAEPPGRPAALPAGAAARSSAPAAERPTPAEKAPSAPAKPAAPAMPSAGARAERDAPPARPEPTSAVAGKAPARSAPAEAAREAGPAVPARAVASPDDSAPNKASGRPEGEVSARPPPPPGAEPAAGAAPGRDGRAAGHESPAPTNAAPSARPPATGPAAGTKAEAPASAAAKSPPAAPPAPAKAPPSASGVAADAALGVAPARADEAAARAAAELAAAASAANAAARARVANPVVVYFSCKGGAGATTLALNAAHQAASDKHPACLIDLDLQLGDALAASGLPPKLSLAQGIEMLNEGGTIGRNLLPSRPSGLHVLSQVGNLNDLERITPDNLNKLMVALRQSFEAIVVDGVRDFGDNTLAVLDGADRVALVVVQEVLAIRRARWAYSILRKIGFESDDISIVVSRFDARSDITLAAMQEMFVGSPLAPVHNEAALITQSLDRGQPLGEWRAEAPIARSVGAASDHVLYNIAPALPEGPKAKDRHARRPGFFGRLFGRKEVNA